jgi:hypothetical protein
MYEQMLNQDVSASVSTVPLSELPDPCLQHLIGMEKKDYGSLAYSAIITSSPFPPRIYMQGKLLGA